MLGAALQRQRDDESQMESDYLGLKPLEQAVLWRMLEVGTRFRHDAEALAFYRAQTGEKVTAQRAQNALESLRQRTPALVWKSARGEYAVEDAAMHLWFEDRKAAGRWPPKNRQGAFEHAQLAQGHAVLASGFDIETQAPRARRGGQSGHEQMVWRKSIGTILSGCKHIDVRI